MNTNQTILRNLMQNIFLRYFHKRKIFWIKRQKWSRVKLLDELLYNIKFIFTRHFLSWAIICGVVPSVAVNLCLRAICRSKSSSVRSTLHGFPNFRVSTSRILARSSCASDSIARKSTFMRNKCVRFTL